MAVDIFRQRQMACKVIKLDKSPQKWTGKVNLSRILWREVDLLKNISHVRRYTPLLTLTDQMFSQTSYTSSVSSLVRKSCMTVSSILDFRVDLSPATSFQTL